MIRYRDTILEDYFIDPLTAIITDKNGVVQEIKISCGRPCWKGMHVHCIQAHTAWGYKKGFVVHHIDENPLNNALTNLKYLTTEEHSSLHRKDKHLSEKTKVKIGSARKGKHHSEKTKAKIGAISKGRKLSEEQKAKISLSEKGFHWWNNSIENKFQKECPGIGWTQGRLI